MEPPSKLQVSPITNDETVTTNNTTMTTNNINNSSNTTSSIHHSNTTACNEEITSDCNSSFLKYKKQKSSTSTVEMKCKYAAAPGGRHPSFYTEGLSRIFKDTLPDDDEEGEYTIGGDMSNNNNNNTSDNNINNTSNNTINNTSNNNINNTSNSNIKRRGWIRRGNNEEELKRLTYHHKWIEFTQLFKCNTNATKNEYKNNMVSIPISSNTSNNSNDVYKSETSKNRMKRIINNNKIRSHVVIEVFDGTHCIHHWQCSELLEAINSYDRIVSDEGSSGVGMLTYRDCRQVFSDVHQISSLEVRRGCIVICLPPVTCFVMCNKVFILIVEELKADELIQQLTRLSRGYDQREREIDNSKVQRPFEFVAMECIITAAFEQLNDDILILEEHLATVENKIREKRHANQLVLEELHFLKEPVSIYDDRVKGFDKAFNELIADTEDMKRMELTSYRIDPTLYEKDRKAEAPNPDLLILLEYFDQELDQFNDRVRHLINSIKNTERLLALRLSLNRNHLIQLDLSATILGTGIAIGTCLSGIFGMNLRSGYENSTEMFYGMSGAVGFFCVVSLIVLFFIVKRTAL